MVGRMILNVRANVRDPNRERVSDSLIINLFNDAQYYATALLPKLWFLYVDTWETAGFTGFGPLSSIGNGVVAQANTTKYSLAQWSDIDSIDKIRYYYNNGGAFLLWDLEPLAAVDFDRFLYNQNRIKNDIILSFKLLPPDGNSAQGYFEVDPVNLGGTVGTFYPVYWKKPTMLNTIMDTTDFPFPQLLEDYASWKIHKNMTNFEEADRYRDAFFGPSTETPIQSSTGIKLLELWNNKARRANGYGRKLWNFRGKRGTGNFFGKGIVSRDFYKESYM